MAKYTTQLRSICEELSGFGKAGGYTDVEQIVTAAMPKIFSFSYPIFNEGYRGALQKKILMHFYTREIGFETYGLWKLKLQTRLNEIMPYYNQLYESEQIQFDPMANVKFTEVLDSDKNQTQDDRTSTDTNEDYHRSTTTNGADYDLYSATPQGGLQGVDSEAYLTEATKYVKGAGAEEDNSGNTTTDSTYNSTVNATQDDTRTIEGKNSAESFSEFLQQYRDTFLNIDMQVIDDLEPLFMGLW